MFLFFSLTCQVQIYLEHLHTLEANHQETAKETLLAKSSLSRSDEPQLSSLMMYTY